jgi:hypothetical protein
MLGFKEKAYFRGTPGSERAPAVRFDFRGTPAPAPVR